MTTLGQHQQLHRDLQRPWTEADDRACETLADSLHARLLLAARAGEKRRLSHRGGGSAARGTPKRTRTGGSRDGHVARRKRLVDAAEDGVEPEEGWDEALIWASGEGYSDVVGAFLRHERGNPAARSNLAIRRASARGHVTVVLELLRSDSVNPSARSSEALREASANGHAAVVEALLDAGRVRDGDGGGDRGAAGHGAREVDPTAVNNEALIRASAAGHRDVVDLLLRDGRADPTSNGREALVRASAAGHWDVVGLLLQDRRVKESLEATVPSDGEDAGGASEDASGASEDAGGGAVEAEVGANARAAAVGRVQTTPSRPARPAVTGGGRGPGRGAGGAQDAAERAAVPPVGRRDGRAWWDWLRGLGVVALKGAGAILVAGAVVNYEYLLEILRSSNNYQVTSHVLGNLFGPGRSDVSMLSAALTAGTAAVRSRSDEMLEQSGMGALRFADVLSRPLSEFADSQRRAMEDSLGPGEQEPLQAALSAFWKHLYDE